MASLDEEEKHIEGLKNYRGLNKFKRACLNMNLDSNGKKLSKTGVEKILAGFGGCKCFLKNNSLNEQSKSNLWVWSVLSNTASWQGPYSTFAGSPYNQTFKLDMNQVPA